MELHELAKKIRLHALEMTNNGGSSHIASVFSIADILACLYGKLLNVVKIYFKNKELLKNEKVFKARIINICCNYAFYNNGAGCNPELQW